MSQFRFHHFRLRQIVHPNSILHITFQYLLLMVRKLFATAVNTEPLLIVSLQCYYNRTPCHEHGLQYFEVV